MIERLIRFLKRPILIVHAPPSQRVLIGFWCLVALVWPVVHITNIMTTVVMVEGDVPATTRATPAPRGQGAQRYRYADPALLSLAGGPVPRR
jgi:hypothetical protein